jgi:hypothetical protein
LIFSGGWHAATLEDGSAPAPIVPRVTYRYPGDTCNFDDFEDESLPIAAAIAADAQKLFSEF